VSYFTELEEVYFFVFFGILLGHVFFTQGLLVDPAKIVVIMDLEPPTSIRYLRETMGHIGYYRKFIKGYAQIKTLMENLLKNEAKFQWNKDCHKGLDTLKQKPVTVSISIFPDWKKEFHVHIDVSSIVLGSTIPTRGGRHRSPNCFCKQPFFHRGEKLYYHRKRRIHNGL